MCTKFKYLKLSVKFQMPRGKKKKRRQLMYCYPKPCLQINLFPSEPLHCWGKISLLSPKGIIAEKCSLRHSII